VILISILEAWALWFETNSTAYAFLWKLLLRPQKRKGMSENEGRILVIGSSGQIGTELVLELRNRFGNKRVIASDIREGEGDGAGPFIQQDILDKESLEATIRDNNVTQVYLLAALLSATAESSPMFAWKLNMEGLFNILELARAGVIQQVFWPSSIAVFGPTTPKVNTPQLTVAEPTTVYGISKQAGEQWCAYYHRKYGVDVRSVRYPGLIGWKSQPGGGTTDYAVDIFHAALDKGSYSCFLSSDTELPMMYMDDAIDATIKLMEAPDKSVQVRTSYNISGLSFSPAQIAAAIKARIPGFEISYAPDHRQSIASSWPRSIDDQTAFHDWGWKARYDLDMMVDTMIDNLRNKAEPL
jgi:nucleoside-diphosphate-sugar epimerase